MKNTLNAAFAYVSHAFQVLHDDKLTSTFAGVSAALLNLIMNSIQMDIFILLGMIAMIALNTWSGIRKAKKQGQYSTKELKDSVMSRTIGYLILLCGVSIFCIILFVASLRDDTRLFSDYWFNLPVVLLMVFLSSVEFKSMLENLEELGINVPGFVKKIPDAVQDKIDDINPIK